MLQLIKDTLSFTLGRTNHPIYRRELEGWSFIRPWRKLRRGCLPTIGVVLLISVGVWLCCGVMTGWGIAEDVSVQGGGFLIILAGIAGGFIVGIYFAGELIRWVSNLLATALSATAISAEIEAQTFALIRLTPIQVREIVLAKLGAVFQQLRLPIIVTTIIRTIIVVCAILAVIGLAVFARAASPPGTPLIPPIPGSPIINIMAVLCGLLLLVLWIAYYLLQPALRVMLFSAVGLYASSLSKTRANGLVGAIGMRLGLWVISYITNQAISSSLSFAALPLYAFPTINVWLGEATANQPGGLVLLGLLFSFLAWLLVIAVPLAAVLIFISLTIRRTRRLPYGI
jgi:hypothetical protein